MWILRPSNPIANLTGLIDLLQVLAVPEPDEAYRTLLGNVKCSTINSQHIQFLLAARGFALLSFAAALLDFYAQLADMQEADGFARPGTAAKSKPKER